MTKIMPRFAVKVFPRQESATDRKSVRKRTFRSNREVLFASLPRPTGMPVEKLPFRLFLAGLAGDRIDKDSARLLGLMFPNSSSVQRTNTVHLLGWLIYGLIVGTISKAIHRGEDPAVFGPRSASVSLAPMWAGSSSILSAGRPASSPRAS